MKKRIYVIVLAVSIIVLNLTTDFYAAENYRNEISKKSSLEKVSLGHKENDYSDELNAYVDEIVKQTDSELILGDPNLDGLREMLDELKRVYSDYSYEQLRELLGTVESENDYNKLLGKETTYNVNTNFSSRASIGTSTGSVLSNDLWSQTCNYNCMLKKSGVTYNYLFRNVIGNQQKCIPGLGGAMVGDQLCNWMVPQAICYANGYVIISACCENGDEIHNSVLYVLKASTLEYVCMLILDVKSHVGGIAYDSRSRYLWVCNSDNNTMAVYYMNHIEMYIHDALQVSSKTRSIGSFASISVDVKPSFCTFYDGMLWVGEFNTAYIKNARGYSVNGTSLQRGATLSLPLKSQGMAFFKYNSQVYCSYSTSYGRTKDSNVYTYKIDDYDKRMGNATMTRSFVKSISMPSMLEGISVSGYQVYAVFESAANKYRNGDGNGNSTNPCDRICKFTTTFIFK